jgi:hypothetical protein
MRIWSTLIALVLLLVLAVGIAISWQFFRENSLPAIGWNGWRVWALLAGASLVPAVGLVVWLRTRAGASLAANLFLVGTALAGAASSFVLWLFNNLDF